METEWKGQPDWCFFGIPVIEKEKNFGWEIFWRVRRLEVKLPIFEKSNTNSFERLFLELSYFAEDRKISDTVPKELGIHGELYDSICQNLRNKGYFDGKLALTPLGQKVVEGKDYFLEAMAIANADKQTVFQSAIDGKIIPFFTERETLKWRFRTEGADEKRPPWTPWETCKSDTPKERDIAEALQVAYCDGRCVEDDASPKDSSEKGSPNEWVQAAEKRVRIIDPNDEDYCYVKCRIVVDPVRIRNDNDSVDYIWDVRTPFGKKGDKILRDSLNTTTEPSIMEKLREIVANLREELPEKLRFLNQMKIQLFDEYPQLMGNATLKQYIEAYEAQKQILNEGYSVTTYRVALSNVIGGMTRLYRSNISTGKRQTIRDWLDQLDHKEPRDRLLNEKLNEIAKKHNQYYDGFEKTYSTGNGNISRKVLRNLEDDEEDEKGNKKERMAYLLLAVEWALYKEWKCAMKTYTEKTYDPNRNTSRSLYEDIARIEWMRNNHSAHDSINCFEEIRPEEIQRGDLILRTLIEAYYKEEKP